MEKTEQPASNPAATAEEAARQITEQVQQVANKAKEAVQQTVSQVGTEAHKVQQTVAHISTDAWRTVSEASRSMRETAYTVKETASNSLLSAAESIRREAVKGGNDETIRYAHQLARSMEKAAVYLDSHTFDQISEAAAAPIKQNPWQSLGIAFIVGMILGLLLNSGRD
jgi:ElaB/YqjD/DUF883 family membrane-anchored ribosome-binding protein